VLNNDGLDYVPTNKHILFGHHFAAIAGAGPLVGPVLAAQMGYLPGTLWLIAGVVLAGAVQDFMVLFLSTRRNGRSLGDMVREEMGRIPGTIALFGCFLIMIIILAVLALIVVKALAESPWGMFTVMATIPIAMFMGIYMRYIRPGRIGEISVIGVVLLLLSIWLGPDRRGSGLGPGLHLHRRADHLDAGRLRFRRRRAAGVAGAGAARLPVDLPQDRHHRRPGHRHPDHRCPS
jgi:carbon starvation protein